VWVWQGWLFEPVCPFTSADLERWFAGNLDLPGTEDSEQSQPVTASCWRQGVEQITVVHVPQRAWLLTCSLGFMALGFLLFLVARRNHENQTTIASWFWAYLALLPVAVMLGLFFQPTLTAAISYGCLPGAFVLVLAILVHLVMQERHRRQIVFLPSFQRGGGSSLIRKQGSVSRHGEPSTVDAPPRLSNSQWPTGEILRTESNSGNKSG